MSDDFEEFKEPDELDYLFWHPLELSEENWISIRQNAQAIMKQRECGCEAAVIISYLELFELSETEKTRH